MTLFQRSVSAFLLLTVVPLGAVYAQQGGQTNGQPQGATPSGGSLTAPMPQAGSSLIPNPSNIPPPANTVPTTLTLGDAIRLATERNYTVRSESNALRRNEIELRRSQDALLPAASASGSYNYTYSLVPLSDRTLTFPADSLAGAPQRQIITPAGSQGLSYNIGASFNIFNGGSDAARIRGASDQLDASRGTLAWTRQQIAYNVTSDYINALRSRELVAAAEQTLAEGQAQLNLQRGLYQAGSIPIGQVYQQEAVVGQNEVALIQARNDFENAKADLLFLLNVPPNDYNRYDLTVTGVDTVTTAAHRATIDTTVSAERINAVIDTRPDVGAERALIASMEEQITETRGALLPSLDASAGLSGRGANSDLTKVHVTNALSAGLSLQIPIFDRNQNRLLIEEQEVNVESERIRLEQLVQQIRSDAAKSVNNIQAASQALDATERALRSAEESLRLAEERLRVGAGTQVDVIVAQSQVETARTNRVNAKYNFVLAQRQLDFTLGQWNY